MVLVADDVGRDRLEFIDKMWRSFCLASLVTRLRFWFLPVKRFRTVEFEPV